MPHPFVIKEFPGVIEINEKIGIGDDCSGSISYGLLSSEKYPDNEYNEKDQHRWIQHYRLTLADVGRHLGCLIKDVYYTIAGGNGYVWESPCAFTLEKNGWILTIQKKYNKGMPFIWKLVKLKHNRPSKSCNSLRTLKLYQWDNVSSEVKKQMRDLEYKLNKEEKNDAKNRKILFSQEYDPKLYVFDEVYYEDSS